jgi:hypothetical protein
MSTTVVYVVIQPARDTRAGTARHELHIPLHYILPVASAVMGIEFLSFKEQVFLVSSANIRAIKCPKAEHTATCTPSISYLLDSNKRENHHQIM